ncbi:MAG: DUF2189 domain-containing protein [Pseudomonadota bacterium]
MSALPLKPRVAGMVVPAIRAVTLGRPLHWLSLGLDDLRRAWPVSLAYGALFALAGWLLLDWARDSVHLSMALLSGFALVAPFLALGFLAVSSRLEHGLDSGGLLHPFVVVRRNGASIGLFAVLLAFLLSVWERLSALLVGLFVKQDLVATGYFSFSLLFDGDHLGFLLAYGVFGVILASLVFALTVITLPLLIDRPLDLVTAMVTSLHVVARNPLPLLFWAMLIVLHLLAGLGTGLLGLVVLFPILGHATWHAYRDLVAPE